MALIEQIVEIYDNYDYTTEVLVASVRGPQHIVEAARMGADVCTCPAKVIEQMFHHPLTDSGLERFLKDWEKAQAAAPRVRSRPAVTRPRHARRSGAPGRSRRRRGPRPPAARGRQAHGARAHRRALRSRHLRGDRQARHAPLPRLRHGRRGRAGRRRRRRRRAASTAASSTPSLRTSPSSAARCRRPTPRRSARSWISR